MSVDGGRNGETLKASSGTSMGPSGSEDDIAMTVKEVSNKLKQKLHTIVRAHPEYQHLVVLDLETRVRSR